MGGTPNYYGTIGIGNGATSASTVVSINIGCDYSSLTLNNGIKISKDLSGGVGSYISKLNTESSLTSLVIGDNILTKSITLGSEITSGTIGIGTGSAFTGNIGIGTGATAATGNVYIGNNYIPATLAGGFKFYRDLSGGVGFSKSILDVDDDRTSLYLGNNIKTGSIYLGDNLTSGDIYLGRNNTSAGIITLGSINSYVDATTFRSTKYDVSSGGETLSIGSSLTAPASALTIPIDWNKYHDIRNNRNTNRWCKHKYFTKRSS